MIWRVETLSTLGPTVLRPGDLLDRAESHWPYHCNSVRLRHNVTSSVVFDLSKRLFSRNIFWVNVIYLTEILVGDIWKYVEGGDPVCWTLGYVNWYNIYMIWCYIYGTYITWSDLFTPEYMLGTSTSSDVLPRIEAPMFPRKWRCWGPIFLRLTNEIAPQNR